MVETIIILEEDKIISETEMVEIIIETIASLKILEIVIKTNLIHGYQEGKLI